MTPRPRRTLRPWRLPLMSALLLAAAAVGCMGGYGRAKLDDELTGRFLAGQVPADYAYYFNGREGMPYAIIGIRPGFTLAARFWTPLEPNTDAFRKMAQNAWTDPNGDPPVAGYLLAPDGGQVGLWYSYWPWPTIKMAGPGEVVVYSPYQPGKSESPAN